jgi:hypothetical protein
MDGDSIINLSYDIEYYNYRIFVIEQISKQYDIIFNIFDDSLNENLVKLYILVKKDKLNEESNKYIDSIFELIFELKNINKISGIIFLNMIISILKIIIIIPNLIESLNKTKYNKLIDIEIIKLKFTFLIEELSKNNLLIYNLNKLLTVKNNIDEIKKIIELITKILASEYFMEYKSLDILRLINNKLKIIKNNSILQNILKFKNKIIYEYDNLSLKYNDLYNDINIMINDDHVYKISNNYFLEMLTDIKMIENIKK